MTRRMMYAVALLLFVAVVTLPEWGMAQSANPWEKPIDDIATSMISKVAPSAFLVAIGVFAIMWWFGAHAIMGTAVGLIIAGAIVGNADTIASWLGLGG
jgi:type IV secretory pathway VirB2 component (pilin)